MRQIPKKNYIYALLILVITVPLTFLLINTFKNIGGNLFICERP